MPLLPPIDRGSWRTGTSINPLDDSVTVTASLEASEGVGGILGDEAFRLVARCLSNTTEVYVEWHDYLGDDDQETIRTNEKRVTYRFPPAGARTELWSVSTNNEATFAANPIPFLRELVENDRLVTQTIPYADNQSLASFDLTGAREALAPIAETCGWTLPVGD